MIAPDTLLQNRYLVVKQIGQGGMGAVYIATDQRFGSTVALKETFFDDPSLRRAFEREARLLNHLRHPALPRVSDHFAEEDGQFLVMEYISGDDLSEKLKERDGAFTLSEVLNWTDQLLDALDYLHTQEPQVVHRDIKPQNLKLTGRGHIVLLDFGLAKGTPMQTKVTATGSVFGYSRNYAPLEQIQGAGTDPRSDIYSLGATVYHLMTGVTPPDALTRATAVLNGQPDPLLPANEVHPQVTPSVAAVITRAMAQNASQRPQTAAAMRDELREAARQTHSEAGETNAPRPVATNVHEQETRLMFGAASLAGANIEKTKITDEDASPTEIISSPTTSAKASSTDVRGTESAVTKVAASAGANPSSRGRIIGIAASVLLLAVAALGVYRFTRPAQTTQETTVETNQNTTVAPQTSNAEEHQPKKIIIIEKGKDIPAETTAPTTPAQPSSTTVGKTAKSSKPTAKSGQTVVEAPESAVTPPAPVPETPEVAPAAPQTRRTYPGMTAEQQKRIEEERQRSIEERRKAMILRRRILRDMGIDRQRRRQQQQQQTRDPY
jgi:serine/threonine protein kinase